MQPHLKNFLKAIKETQDVKIWIIFRIFLKFKKRVYKIFIDINTKRTAERILINHA